MIAKTIPFLRQLPALSKYLFAHQKISPQKQSTIKQHSLHTQYQVPTSLFEDLHPTEHKHTNNRWNIIEDPTHIKFVIEDGGFPNCSDIGRYGAIKAFCLMWEPNIKTKTLLAVSQLWKLWYISNRSSKIASKISNIQTIQRISTKNWSQYQFLI